MLTLENIALDHPSKPFLADRGVPEHDVLQELQRMNTLIFMMQYVVLLRLLVKLLIARDLYDSVCKMERVIWY